jgi:hypothetical protein
VFWCRREGRAGAAATSGDGGLLNLLSKEDVMRKAIVMLATAAAFTALAALPSAMAQQAFDSNKFFSELSARSVSMPQGFDSKKFFDELTAKSVSSGKKIDAKAFFDELQSRGVKVPANFDPQKVFSDVAATGAAMPPMVETK